MVSKDATRPATLHNLRGEGQDEVAYHVHRELPDELVNKPRRCGNRAAPR
jgi:hypothetical protein